MYSRFLKPIAVAIFVFVIITPANADTRCQKASCEISLRNLEFLAGDVRSEASGISLDGSVVIGNSYGATGLPHAVYWNTSLGPIALGSLGGEMSTALGINLDGSVVVGEATHSGNTPIRAFRWTATGGMQDLGTLPGGFHSTAYAVSADGNIVVGSAQRPGSGGVHAFRWTAATGMQDIDTSGGAESHALDVSSDGSTIVGAYQLPGGGRSHAFQWTATAGMMDLGTLGGNFAAASGTNTDGSVIVGESSISNGQSRAFRWTSSSGVVSLGTLGGLFSAATATNADGSIVVGASETAAQSTSRAFRWTAATGMQDLNFLLADAGVDMRGITLLNAEDISANGQLIVGWAFFPSSSEGYILRYVDIDDEVIGGITNARSVMASVQNLSDARIGTMAQQHAFAVPMLGGDKPIDNSSEAGIYASAGSAAAGGYARYATGGGIAVLAGVGYGRENYDQSSIDDSIMGAFGVRYLPPVDLAWQPFAEIGGWWTPEANLEFERTYMNGAGTATGVGKTEGELGYVYGRAGLLIAVAPENQIAVSAEIGREWLWVDGYSEALNAANPFEAHVAAGTEAMDIAKARLQWSFEISQRFDATVYVSGAYSFNRESNLVASVTGVGTFKAIDDSNAKWVEYGARIGYALTEAVTLDVFTNGVSGEKNDVDTRVHVGAGLRIGF